MFCPVTQTLSGEASSATAPAMSACGVRPGPERPAQFPRRAGAPPHPDRARFTPRELPGGDFPAFVTRGRMVALWDCRARVLVHAPADVVAARIPVGSWAVEVLGEETSLLDAGAQTPELLAVHLAALGLDFHVDERAAPELAAALSTLAGRCAAAGSG